jgi:predicted AAA+ superfamily ATPase
MTKTLTHPLRMALSEILAKSLKGDVPLGTLRRIPGRLELPGKVTAVVGMRRAGKTTFLHQIRHERLASGTPRTHLPYVNFEDERLAELEGSQLGFLLEEYGRNVADATRHGPVTWCFDEIQLVPGWERFVRRMLDEGGVEVLVTGSSAALLSREIATSLRGRAWEVPLFPFSFTEMLAHREITIPNDARFITAAERSQIEHHFLEWLKVGGFPEAQTLDIDSRRQLLRDYVDVAMLRDVVERHGVSNVHGLRWMVRHLLGNAASPFSVEKFHARLKNEGVAISRDTLHHFLGYLEDCFLVRVIWLEAASERQRMVNPRKVYPVDMGLIPLFDPAGRANLGHALETAVLIELQRRRCDVTYVRTAEGSEVDFMARLPNGSMELIQVCADASTAETAARELRALEAAGRQYPKATCRLLTLTWDTAPAETAEGILIQPVYEWILNSGIEGDK